MRGERIFTELEELAQWCAARQSRRRVTAGGALPAFLLNTRRLQLFSALARHRHMPSAAQTLGLTQPAVSSAIRIMETGAGMPLFHRSPRGLLLTSEGETFVLHIRRRGANALLIAYNPHTTGLGFAGLDLLIVAAWGVAGLLVALRMFSWQPLGR